METFIKAKDAEIVKLLADNKQLSEELRQCQADKEFVWSLWKRLQVSSPDLTQAISLVMQREKEKLESKDRKVLEILQSKDEQIENLQDTVASLKNEVDKLVQMKSTLETTRAALTSENEDLRRCNDALNMRVAKMETVERDQSDGLRKSMEDLRKQRDELDEKVTKLLIDLQTSRLEAESVNSDNAKLKKRVRKLDDDNQELNFKCQKLQKERESLSEEILHIKSELAHYRDGEDTARRELDSREQNNQEIKHSYQQLKQHTDEQKKVILELQALNDDSHKVLKEQEQAYKDELAKIHKMYSDLVRKYESLQKSHSNAKKVHQELKERVEVQDRALLKTEKELKRSLDMATGRHRRNQNVDVLEDLELQVSSQQEELDLLRRRLKEKNLQLAEMKNEHPVRDNDYGRIQADHTFSPIVEKTNKEKVHRSRSLSPSGRDVAFVNRRLQAMEEKLESTKRLLDLKRDELKELKTAHDRRLNRLKHVQTNYRELKDTLGEKDIPFMHRSKNSKKPRRLNARELRHEDNDAVWNELAYYKKENRNLMHEKFAVEEEMDGLRVQAAMDKATVHELNMCLKQEREDLVTRMKRDGSRLSSTPKKRSTSHDPAGPLVTGSTTTLRHMIKNLERKLENSAEDVRLVKLKKNQLAKEIRTLKGENKSLKQEITDSRQSSANLRREIIELRRKAELAEEKREQAELDVQDLNREVDSARAEQTDGLTQMKDLSTENNQLRAELADLKAELREITQSLEAAEIQSYNRAGARGRDTAPVISARTNYKSNSARKRQKFLNKSINNIRDALGKDVGKEGYDHAVASETGADDTEDDGTSEYSSLGQSIVRVARSMSRVKDLETEEDDTLVDEEMLDVKPTKSKTSARSNASSRYGTSEITSLKQRLASMQQQCATLRTERQKALKEVSDQRDRNELQESEIQGLQNRLKSAKMSIQKLHREVEVISREKEELQRSMESLKNTMPEPQKYSDTDYRLLENKLRSASSDSHHYMEQMKKIQQESEEKNENIAGLKEKISKLERDVTMKRQLIDEQRSKLKLGEKNMKNDQGAMLEMEEKLKIVSEELIHKKNYIDSLKRQVQAVGRDKARYEQSYNEAKTELEKRLEQVSVEQARKLEAEHLASHLESTVEHQLTTLATKSEEALEKLQGQLTVSLDKNREYTTCVQILSSQILEMVNQIRNSIFHHQEEARQEKLAASRDQDPSMSRAQSIACSILNMSKADFEELMTPVDITKKEEEERRRCEEIRGDSEWKMKVDEISKETPPFAKSLNRLLWDKVQDVVRLAEERCRLQFEMAVEKT